MTGYLFLLVGCHLGDYHKGLWVKAGKRGTNMPLLKLEYTDNIELENKQWSSLFVKIHQLVADTVGADVVACKSRWVGVA